MNERLWPTDPDALLSIAAGVIISTGPSASPTKLRSAADEAQKRAKLRSKETSPRPSVIAIHGKDDLIVIEHDSGGFAVRIVGEYFETARETGITFVVTNTGKDPMPPFKVGLFHPKLGSTTTFHQTSPGRFSEIRSGSTSVGFLRTDVLRRGFRS